MAFPRVSENSRMTDLKDAAQTVTDLLRLLAAKGDLDVSATVRVAEGAVAGTPELSVELSGPDCSLLTERNGELLFAIEHLAAKVLRLEPEEHDRISFDAGRFKANRDQALRQMAETAIAEMREQSSGRGARAHFFPPMTSRERRLLHLLLAPSGLKTASVGEGPGRAVVLYPEGVTPPPEAPARSRYASQRSPQQRSGSVGDERRRPRGFSPR